MAQPHLLFGLKQNFDYDTNQLAALILSNQAGSADIKT